MRVDDGTYLLYNLALQFLDFFFNICKPLHRKLQGAPKTPPFVKNVFYVVGYLPITWLADLF